MKNQKNEKQNQEQTAYIIRTGEKIQSEIGETIKQERMARGLRRSTLAKMSSITEDTLARVESGTQDYRVGNLCRVWATLGIKEDYVQYVQPHKLRERNRIIREIVTLLNLLRE